MHKKITAVTQDHALRLAITSAAGPKGTPNGKASPL